MNGIKQPLPPDPGPGREGKLARAYAPPPRSGWSRCWPVLIAAVLTLAALGLGWHEHITLGNIVTFRDRFHSILDQHRVSTLIAYVFVYIGMTALSLPGGLVLTVAGGLMFGWLVGSIASILAATAGATLVFLIARTALGEGLNARVAPWLAKLKSGFNADAFNYLLFLRLVPAFPFWFVNIAPAILGVPLRTYIVTTFLGIIPGSLALAAAGAGLDSVIAAAKANYATCVAHSSQVAHTQVAPNSQQPCRLAIDAHALITKEIMWALVLLGFAALIPIALKKWKACHAKAK
jgi:uncharacterized membrane protein YdjX (TVP38/TMEM64 family)